MNTRVFIEALSEPLVAVDPYGTIFCANRAAKALFGLGDSLEGTKLTDMVDTEQTPVRKFLAACWRTSQPLPGTLTLGTSEPVKYRVRGSVLVPPGKPDSAILLHIKPPEECSALSRLNESLELLKQRHTELHFERRRLQGLVDGLSLALQVRGANGDTILVNRTYCDWFGNKTPNVDRPVCDRTTRKVLLNGERRYLHEHTYLVNMRGYEGELFCTTWSDVTREVEAENSRREVLEAALEAQRRQSLGLLAAGLAHDFNNLLVGLFGNMELAEMESLYPDGNPGAYFKNLRRGLERARKIVQQMLDFSGEGNFVEETIDLNALIGEILPIVEANLPPKAEIQHEWPHSKVYIYGDRHQIQQLLINTVQNAGEALQGRRGTITLRAGSGLLCREDFKALQYGSQMEGGQYSWIEVRDSGMGMDKELVGQIFEPFFSTKFVGRGLGLAAVHGIMEGHHGGIMVESEPEKGSRFVYFFPSRAVAMLESPLTEKKAASG